MKKTQSHILIVDDNPENIRVLGTILRKFNYRITVAQSGLQAIQAVTDNKPDLILLDIMMPEMNGFEVCEHLKADPKTQEIEIIFITAAVDQAHELKGLKLGAVDYIHKPFSVPLLEAKIELHLERARGRHALRLKNQVLEENVRLREDIERISRHDLKTPLNALIGYPQLLLMDDNLTPEQHGYLEEMLRAGNEMLSIINNSLDLFKMEMGCYPYHPECVDMFEVMKSIVRDLGSLISSYQVNVTFLVQGQDKEPEQSFVAYAERNLSYSLFANLIRNAVEACTANATILIDMNYENDKAVIAISNPGSVPESIRETFFDKYATAEKLGGTGLGTYSAKLMTKIQRGEIALQTDEKQTTLTVKLPIKA